MIIIQAAAVLFALAMMYTTFLHYKRKDFSTGAFLFWMALWVGFALIVAFAGEAEEIVKMLAFARLMDLVMVAGLAILTIVAFWNFAAVSRLERKLEKSVREKALEGFDKKGISEKK
jgi:hypothetical protein